MKYVIIIGIVLAVAFIMPVATIWSLNALFPSLAIPLTFDTWCATLILSGIISGSTGFTYRSKS